jgi:hypothetical protein
VKSDKPSRNKRLIFNTYAIWCLLEGRHLALQKGIAIISPLLIIKNNQSHQRLSEIGRREVEKNLNWSLMKDKYMTSKYQVCVRVQQNILNAENKRDKIFVDEVETLWREKSLWGSQTQEIHYPKTKQVTKHSYSQKLLQ